MIINVKEKIKAKIGIPIELQWLIYSGKYRKDEHTLIQHDIQNESTLHLVLSLNGGMMPVRLPPNYQCPIAGCNYNGKSAEYLRHIRVIHREAEDLAPFKVGDNLFDFVRCQHCRHSVKGMASLIIKVKVNIAK